MYAYIPQALATRWWKSLESEGLQVKLFDRDADAASLIERQMQDGYWHPEYWVLDNYGGVVIKDNAMMWVGIPKRRRFRREAIPEDALEVMCALLPANRLWRSWAQRTLRKHVVRSLLEQGAKPLQRLPLLWI